MTESYLDQEPLSGAQFDFGQAIRLIKQGHKVARAGWNGNKLPPIISKKPEHIPSNRLEIKGDYCFLLGSKGNVAVFDVELIDKLNGKENFTEGSGGYFTVSFYSNGEQKNLKLHQLLFDCPEGYFIDHINGDILANRSVNIRVVSSKENNANRSSKSGYKGVSFDNSRKKWISSIQIEKKTIHIGRFDTPEEAAEAYDKEAYKHHGEYARLNFPEKSFTPRMWIAYGKGNPALDANSFWNEHTKQFALDNGGTAEVLPYILFKTADDKILMGWLASQSDMLSEDWVIVK